MDNNKVIKRLSFIGIIGNVLLASFKIVAGIIGKSGAMVSDAVHSFSDVFATLIALVGTKLSQKKEDIDHPYGHERFETLASLLLGLILFAAGAGIGYSAVIKIVSKSYLISAPPGVLPLIAAIVSIVSKEAMFQYTIHYADKIESAVFKADAWHHRSDALSSVGALIGIVAARKGLPIMEPIAGLLICICIVWVAIKIIVDSLKKVTDTSCGEDFEKEIANMVKSISGVKNVDMIRTRMFGDKIYVDLEIAVDKDLTLLKAHEISETVHDSLEKKYENIKHVMIHVNPA